VILGADIVRWLLSTGGIIVIVLIVSAWVYAAGRASKSETRTMRHARQTLLAFAIAVAIFSIYGLEFLFARVIVGSLKPFKAAQIAPNKRTAIVLLGSGSWHAMDWTDASPFIQILRRRRENSRLPGCFGWSTQPS
jgi:hypothetical protein